MDNLGKIKDNAGLSATFRDLPQADRHLLLIVKASLR